MPQVTADEVVDPSTWSLRRIIAKSEALERKKKLEERAARAAAAQEGGNGGAGEGAVQTTALIWSLIQPLS